MPGRPKTTAKKAIAIEAAALELYRQVSKATPEIHKETERRHGVSAPLSPWVHVHQTACEFLLAADELGQHSRKAAKIAELGPIRQALSDTKLCEIRRKYQRGAGGRTLEEMDRFKAEAERAYDKLPGWANGDDEVDWVAANLYRDAPDFTGAPSRMAISYWLTLQGEIRGMRAEFWNSYMRKRMSCGDRVPPQPDEPETDVEAGEVNVEELLKRIWDGVTEEPNACPADRERR